MSKSLDRIALLETFVRIADTGSISAAARDLGLTQPSVSRQLAELESRFNTQLMRRNTHSLALTDSGAELLADARQMLDSWEVLEEKHLSGHEYIKGKLKIVAPVALGQHHLSKIACQFQIHHPNVSIRWDLQDEPIRFAEVGCDCWIKIGRIPDDTLVVRKLGRVERMLVASASFSKTHGIPANPKQASQLDAVGLEPFEGGKIPLSHRNGKDILVEPQLKMVTNNIFALKQATLMGIGMSVMPKWFIAEELQSGELIDLLPNWRAPSLDIHVAYLPGRYPPKRLRVFLEFLHEHVPGISGVEII